MTLREEIRNKHSVKREYVYNELLDACFERLENKGHCIKCMVDNPKNLKSEFKKIKDFNKFLNHKERWVRLSDVEKELK